MMMNGVEQTTRAACYSALSDGGKWRNREGCEGVNVHEIPLQYLTF